MGAQGLALSPLDVKDCTILISYIFKNHFVIIVTITTINIQYTNYQIIYTTITFPLYFI